MISPKKKKKQYKSGFSAEIVLKPGYNQRFFGIITDFGSSDPQEVAGSAHFLEHKLFAKEDGDISQKFEELGADVNAFTSFNETMFYCSGVKNNPQLINLLFRLVGEPYFTAENVKKEIPIGKAIFFSGISVWKNELTVDIEKSKYLNIKSIPIFDAISKTNIFLAKIFLR